MSEGDIKQILDRLDGMNARFDQVDTRFDQVDTRLSRMERSLVTLATGQMDLTHLVNDIHARLVKLERDEPWKGE